MDDNRTFLNILSSVSLEYLAQRAGDIRKNTVAGLAIMMLLLIALGVFAFAFIVLIGDAIGSYCGGAFIVGGVYLTVAALLFFLRKRPAQPQSDRWKALLLLVVRNLRDSLSG